MKKMQSSPTVSTLSKEEMKSRALAFAKNWVGPQREEAEAKTFIDDFFEIFGRDRRSVDAQFEHHVPREERGQGKIDLFWKGRLIVEMKSTGKDLSTNPGGAAHQAFKYVDHLDAEERPRWVLVSDFAHFVLYDLGEEVHEYLKGLSSARKTKPVVAAQFTLKELPDKLRHFAFIRDEEQALFQSQPDINLKAVKLLGGLHDELKKTGYSGHNLERFLVRVLFCLFAEDTDIFEWNSFTRFIEKSKKDGSDLGPRLAKLFQVLNQDGAQRSPALDAEYTIFPYVNGGMFAEKLDMADMTPEHRLALVECCRFDWSKISPGVFGSLFQGVMDKKERREKGAHYTSEENILKLINPLFLDALKAEFETLKTEAGEKLSGSTAASKAPIKKRKVKESSSAFTLFHEKLARLKFLDPACGCGNFLVVAYRELRALELEVLQTIYGQQLPLGLNVGDIARVNVDQFFGIELEEFPALIAETAMWLTDHQVNMAFSKAFGEHYARIPLKKSASIHNKNALQIPWEAVLAKEQCSYILGNPPFIGKKEQSADQKSDMERIYGDAKGTGILDYVTAWYQKAARYISGTPIRCAFVSTNSITQGEQVGVFWSQLKKIGIHIHFAHRTFKWANEASGRAQVSVVIIGFAAFSTTKKTIFDYDKNGKMSVATSNETVSPYLIFGSDVTVGNRTTPINGAPEIAYGSMMIDKDRKAGPEAGLILNAQTRRELLDETPSLAPYIKRLYGGDEFLNGVERWCLWLVGANPTIFRNAPRLKARLETVRNFRANSDRPQTKELAATPGLFGEIRQPNTPYLLIPKVSSESRTYIPIGFMAPDEIASGSALVVANATPYHFGILSSEMHNAWMRGVGGRLESRYQYSNNIIYNNFPWPEPTAQQRQEVENAAQAVLDARKPHIEAGATYSDLYDPIGMPAELWKAHQKLDQVVDRAYRQKAFASERERIEHLFGLYEKLTSPLAPTRRRR